MTAKMKHPQARRTRKPRPGLRRARGLRERPVRRCLLLKEHRASTRDRQFQYLTHCRQAFLRRKWPAISVDGMDVMFLRRIHRTRFAGQPARAVPYGIFDLGRNQGFISVGVSFDTPEFAVASIRAWWASIGQKTYPRCGGLLIQADSGGSNASRSWVWKVHLQEFANEAGLNITVTHYPVGASRWNPIEERMFHLISDAWTDTRLDSYAKLLKSIRTTRSHAGFRCKAHLDRRMYSRGAKVSLDEVVRLHLRPHQPFPHWNYTLYSNANEHCHKRPNYF